MAIPMAVSSDLLHFSPRPNPVKLRGSRWQRAGCLQAPDARSPQRVPTSRPSGMKAASGKEEDTNPKAVSLPKGGAPGTLVARSKAITNLTSLFSRVESSTVSCHMIPLRFV
ncbi:unnamed protein product [Prorocentrum cordatum]|uniref:Uncharacterized protein n=1 Tax=Prorocentrum cordatum TaxID=2364126 RepID=A0ABN9PXP2_9DINO|nr:unnamed protein product [Polarella glacialis]